MIILVIILLALVSFVLAWRSLHELEAPADIVKQIEKSVNKVKSWGIILFLKNKRIEYSSSEHESTKEKVSLKS